MPRKDPVARAAYQRAYQEKTDHAGRERLKYQTDPDRRARQTEYRRARLSHYAELQKNYRLTHPKETLVSQAKSRAKKRQLPFDISVDTIDWPTHCPVLGIELDYHCTHTRTRKIQPNSPTLDRRVNDLGYVAGNVFVLSHRANRMKQDATPTELAAISRYANS